MIRAHLAAEVFAYGALQPCFVWTIAHPDGLVLVDTGMIDSTAELDRAWRPVPHSEALPRDVVCVVNTHLHFDHCGGNRLYPGVPIHVQARELAAARAGGGAFAPAGWIDFDGATYVEHDGEAEVLPGIRLLPVPGHTDGHQAVLVDTDAGLEVIAGDVAYSFQELGQARTEGQRLVLGLGATTWLSHVTRPKVPERR
ncbi:MAG TPA: MBL fold metallo-hydrolase [Gaiellaceae bacterium]|nr:MBL fold metallo-hydrolase [Gaiellaceae bacterium]